MSETKTFIVAKDSTKLYTQSWNLLKPKAVIALVHGFGEHISRYDHVANFFNRNEYAVQGMDFRGFGQSDGKRGHTPSYNTFLDDLDIFIADVKKNHPNLPVFLYGHSMGGAIVLSYIIERNPALAGVIASAPLIELAFKPNPITLFLGKMLRKMAPAFTQPGGVNPNHLSRDKEVVSKYIADPLVHNKISSEAGMGILERGAFLNNFSGKMPIPTLILHAIEDKLTSFPASEAFSKRVSGDVTFKKFQGLYHEIHNEPEKQEVLSYILGWLDSK